MDSEFSSVSSEDEFEKSIEQIMGELTTPGKIMIQLNGWRNVCRTLDYIFSQEYDLFQNVSGLAFDLDGLPQVVGYVCEAEQLKNRVLLGMTLKTNIYSYPLNQDQNLDMLEGFDDLDRRLRKLKVWGCHFVILQLDLGFDCIFETKNIPYHNAHYLGIFSSTVQALGMVPIIQFKHGKSAFELSEDESVQMFVETMYRVNKSLYDFDVKLESLIIAQMMRYPLKKSKYSLTDFAKVFVNGLQQALPPAVGGVFFFSEGSSRALGLQVDKIQKLIDRIPWLINCGYNWKIPAVLKKETADEVLKKWFEKQKLIIEMLSMASKGILIPWKPKPTGITDEFVKSHGYHWAFLDLQ